MTRYLGEGWMLPGTDALTKRFFSAGALVFQQCAKCAHVQHPPTDVCGACQSFEFTERTSAGRGRIESLTVAHYAVHPLLKDRVPYVVVLVSIDDVPGVRVIGNVLNFAPSEVRVGQRVCVCFEEAKDPQSGEMLRIPQWELVE
jgi:uncharacterized OB-fold protein